MKFSLSKKLLPLLDKAWPLNTPMHISEIANNLTKEYSRAYGPTNSWISEGEARQLINYIRRSNLGYAVPPVGYGRGRHGYIRLAAGTPHKLRWLLDALVTLWSYIATAKRSYAREIMRNAVLAGDPEAERLFNALISKLEVSETTDKVVMAEFEKAINNLKDVA